MASKKSPINNTNIELEIEALRRFRRLVPFLDRQCRIWREVNGSFTVLCLDFMACPQDLNMNQQEWKEVAKILLHSSHYLGLANSLVLKAGKRIISQISLT